MGVAVIVGTKKGAAILASDKTRESWSHEFVLKGWDVTASTRDEGGRYYAAINNDVFGAAIMVSDDLKAIAVSRLMLDNFDHIKAYWIMLTPRIAQVALRFGANDLDGTVVEENIYHDAGATTPEGMTRADLERLIRAAGCVPVERDTRYNPVDRVKNPFPVRAAAKQTANFIPETSLTLNV